MATMAYNSQIGSRLNGSFATPPPGVFIPPPLERSHLPAFGSTHEPSENIMNWKGGVNSSLYQSCLALKKRLAEVPGFEVHLNEMDEEERESDDSTDPVTSMWNMLRRGYPLMDIFNALKPAVPLDVNHGTVAESKLGKAASYKFMQACLEELKFPIQECFLISDLYGTDTTGFVKVLKVINRVLDILAEHGMLLSTQPQLINGDGPEKSQPRSHQQSLIEELVTSERDYVQHLETLQQFKNQVEQAGLIPGDVVHDIFMNLNALLDFQRRFLIRIEQQNSLDPALQNWGLLFVQYQEGFSVYDPFIANQYRCNEIVSREWEKIKMTPLTPAYQGMVETQSVLGGFLMKPFQRLTKYPMLLTELRKKGDFNEEKMSDLEAGSEATSAILARANAAIDKETRLQATRDLIVSVEDWKGHKMEHFGELVVFGNQTVIKGEGSKEVERDYKIYLFEKILLCCKEMNPNKTKNRLTNKVTTDKKGKQRLQLKGRIFMQNVTDVLSFPKNGYYHLQIYWRGDPGVEHFIIRFPSVEARDKWADLVSKQKRTLSEKARGGTTSETEFVFMKTQNITLNPYEERDDDDGDDDDDNRTLSGATLVSNTSDFSSSRNTSSTSLRLRSAANNNNQPLHLAGRIPPPRFPLPEHTQTMPIGLPPNGLPLKVATSFTPGSGASDDNMNNSYFSPTVESPASFRSSSQTGTYPFPQQNPSHTWGPEGNKHNTAPPMARGPLREEDGVNGYAHNGRFVQRPSLPVMGGSQHGKHGSSSSQSRLRSASSPDFQNNNAGVRRYANGQIQPPAEDIPVPPLPAHMRAPVNRSQNNSPTDSLRGMRGALPSHPRPSPPYAQHSYEPGNQLPPRSEPRYHSPHGSQGSNQSNVGQRMISPALPPATPGELAPSQLKVRIWFEPHPSHVTIVVPIIIKHRSLIDRIDSKMEKVTASSIAKGTARLRYKDTDNEYITIMDDEGVSLAIEEWTMENEEKLRNGTIPDFELHWHELI